jgi:hypothetical protein
MTEQALQALALAKPDGEAGVALKDLTKRLLNREV